MVIEVQQEASSVQAVKHWCSCCFNFVPHVICTYVTCSFQHLSSTIILFKHFCSSPPFVSPTRHLSSLLRWTTTTNATKVSPRQLPASLRSPSRFQRILPKQHVAMSKCKNATFIKCSPSLPQTYTTKSRGFLPWCEPIQFLTYNVLFC